MGNVDFKIMLVPLESDDREQFIIDNQRAFKYGGARRNDGAARAEPSLFELCRVATEFEHSSIWYA